MNTSMRDAASCASPHHVYVLFGFQMLSPWYDEFLDEEDYWFLVFTVGGTLSWGKSRGCRKKKRVTTLLEALFIKVNEIFIFPRGNWELTWSLKEKDSSAIADFEQVTFV